MISVIWEENIVLLKLFVFRSRKIQRGGKYTGLLKLCVGKQKNVWQN